jgi:hypothetical protein
MSEQMAVTGMVGGEYWTVYRVVGRVSGYLVVK